MFNLSSNYKKDKRLSLGYDRVLLLCTLALLGISVILISSASVMEALARFSDEQHYMKRQLVYVFMGLFVGLVSIGVPTSFWEKYAIHGLVFTLFLLILVLIVGREINQAKRWIELGFFNIQPAEILKLVWIIYFSDYTSRKIVEVRFTKIGFIKPMLFVAFIALLLLLQPDFGSLVVVTSITLGILFVAGAGLTKYLITSASVAFIAVLLILFQPYRVARVTSFLDPWQDEFGSGYQLTQSLMAFGRGGLTGEGLGNSIQKLGYLPEAHTDFVTSILGEEFGFVGMSFVIFLEFIIVAKAIILSFKILRKGSIFQGYVAFGIGIWFCLQTVINIGAASGALPTKGLTLPLISYGGSSLMVTMVGVGILMRIDYEWRNQLIKLKKKDKEA